MPSSLLRNSFNNSSSQKIIPFTIAQAVINRFGTIAFGAVLVLGCVLTIGSSAIAMGIDGWKYDPEKGQVEFEIEDGVKPRHFLMAQPARIVVDLVNTQIGNAPPEMSYTSGPVQRITVVQLQPSLTRVTLHMFPSTVFAKGQVAIDRLGDGNRGTSDVWTLRPLVNSSGSGSANSTQGSSTPGSSTPFQIQLKTQTQTLVVPTAPVSPNIPIAVPPAKSDDSGNASDPSLGSRLGSIQPATPPKLEELPPGMSSVLLSQKPGSIGFTPVSPAIGSPNGSPTSVAMPKLETVTPTLPNLEAVKSVAMADGQRSAIEVPKPMTALPKNSLAEPIETPQVLTFERPTPSSTSASQVLNVPPPASTLFPSVPTLPIIVFTPDSQVFAKTGDGLVLPDSLPTVTPTVRQPTTVSVPPLSTISPVAQPRVQQPIAPNVLPNLVPTIVPNSTPTAFPLPDRVPQPAPSQMQPQPIVPKFTSQPAIQPSIFPAAGIAQPVDRNPIASSPSSAQPDVISFGQPLRLATPPQLSQPAPIFATVPTPDIVTMTANDGRTGLPSGTALTVRYTGISSLSVKDGSRKEMLVLQSAIRDRNGMPIAPEGTTVYGAFEGGTNRFVAESIVIQGQLISLIAESPNLGGARSPSERSLLQNSGIGVLAGVLIGGLSGGSAIGGAAAGAIASYVTAPKVATIQPGQTLELKLTQDWIIPFGVKVSQRFGG
ncbi:MAG: AMIN domain-containing protein [Cyanobacteria bacterium]|nr:AMIN domain-containing protein [Cyanobacteriota bacterium]